MHHSLTIGRLAKEAEVSIDSIRFYERRGLLAEPLRTESNYRVYPLETATRLRFIKKAQNLGFSLNEIQELLELQQNPVARRSEVKAKTADKIRAIRLKIKDLSRMLGVLEHLNAACDGLGSIDECPILEGLAADDCQKCHH
ncbi:MerR family transcriptional regulator [Geopsychrobacter electrodiphilus]|uniref:MerR family transcriptional regulator n=1 Tax=Geopsychrobacter electrodiphilus TaxID=225196 RepID=UPI00036EFCB8|nr:MerR family transcriptional regulator [Geopsychrobacter electrodiphilus]